MRLNSIKLSGFKSFAEPTTLQLPGQLVGVVGPNGCGKSNIIDAVRWVLGESKASELRGESMQDVIFNGSGQRKPAGRASVELVFDNSAARAGGPWNHFAEIAVKRVLTRDGNSSYFINNQPVRRRDVQDVFMGTGLGPRAYAIIGQGTISRIIESKPEELRLFLEEAAGVSKYKERRRETENRLKDTRENLTRVEDILRELNANLDKLESQAEVATRYRALQTEATLKQHQLWFLRHRDAANEEARVKADVAEAQKAIDARMAELTQVQADLEQIRQAHYAEGDSLHDAQGKLADAALEVSRLEERIRYVVEGRQRIEQRLAELRGQDAQWGERRLLAAQEVDTAVKSIMDAASLESTLAASVDDHAQNLPGLDEALRTARAAADEQRGKAAEVQRDLQVLAAERRSAEEQLRALRPRRERLDTERKGLVVPEVATLAELDQRRQDTKRLHDEAAARADQTTQALPALEAKRRVQLDATNAAVTRHTDLSARLAALRALQDKVQTEGKLKPWLARHGLEGLQGLWTRVHIEAGWETALESALRERLSAFEISRLETVLAFEKDAPPSRLAFYTPPHGQIANTHRTLPRLSDLLRLGDAGLAALLNDWLDGVYTAPSLEAALADRGKLTHGEVIMTREGHAVSPYAVAYYAPDSEQAGMLARAQEIENLGRQIRAQSLMADEARGALVRCEAACTEAAQRAAQARSDATAAQTRAHEADVAWLKLSQEVEAGSARRGRVDEELSDVVAQIGALDARVRDGEGRFEILDQQLADAQQHHATLDDAVIAAERALADARQAWNDAQRQAQEAQFQSRTLAARRDEHQRAIETAVAQVAANALAAEQLRADLAGLDDAMAQAGLQTALGTKLDRESTLAATRSRYDDLSAKLRSADEQRLAFERSLEPLREKLHKLQMEEQAAQLGGKQYLDQLQAAEIDLDELAQVIERDNVKLWGLPTEVERLTKEIATLGAVNLAALDELTTARDRKQFLDAQTDDLEEAITTLEGAIHKIDLETRALLGDTFRLVNEHFGKMFPVLFAGGTARLVMTGDEILDAGVQVLAQPPGKKNSTIHLLSGGEKALTAIALVFAIFQLNPAPFCLLDEVDAPLDDANTDRYCKLVTEMSEGTQFLYISHNKIAMEMAKQLIGVTMQEQGVSRIVAVDMDEAISMAEAA
jgi:chromosome segregation protein